jgi:amino acid transporter
MALRGREQTTDGHLRRDMAAGRGATGLRRDIATVGLLSTSAGSIIGSSWLGSLNASLVAGPAAVIAWVLGGAIMILLALIHAELASAYPVGGGNT